MKFDGPLKTPPNGNYSRGTQIVNSRHHRNRTGDGRFKPKFTQAFFLYLPKIPVSLRQQTTICGNYVSVALKRLRTCS